MLFISSLSASLAKQHMEGKAVLMSPAVLYYKPSAADEGNREYYVSVEDLDKGIFCAIETPLSEKNVGSWHNHFLVKDVFAGLDTIGDPAFPVIDPPSDLSRSVVWRKQGRNFRTVIVRAPRIEAHMLPSPSHDVVTLSISMPHLPSKQHDLQEFFKTTSARHWVMRQYALKELAVGSGFSVSKHDLHTDVTGTGETVHGSGVALSSLLENMTDVFGQMALNGGGGNAYELQGQFLSFQREASAGATILPLVLNVLHFLRDDVHERHEISYAIINISRFAYAIRIQNIAGWCVDIAVNVFGDSQTLKRLFSGEFARLPSYADSRAVVTGLHEMNTGEPPDVLQRKKDLVDARIAKLGTKATLSFQQKLAMGGLQEMRGNLEARFRAAHRRETVGSGLTAVNAFLGREGAGAPLLARVAFDVVSGLIAERFREIIAEQGLDTMGEDKIYAKKGRKLLDGLYFALVSNNNSFLGADALKSALLRCSNIPPQSWYTVLSTIAGGLSDGRLHPEVGGLCTLVAKPGMMRSLLPPHLREKITSEVWLEAVTQLSHTHAPARAGDNLFHEIVEKGAQAERVLQTKADFVSTVAMLVLYGRVEPDYLAYFLKGAVPAVAARG